MIARLRHFVPVSTLHNIYCCLILPYITYGLIVWGHASKRYVNKILILQKRALQLIYLKKYKEHAIPLFIESKILPINMLYIKSVCNLMHNVSNESCPSSISDCFIHSRQIHDHNTRHCISKNYYIEYSRLTKTNSSFARVGAKVWNNISTDVHALGRTNFNKIIKKTLLKILELEDDYVDVPTLVQQMVKH
jgi:hypothetical protein